MVAAALLLGAVTFVALVLWIAYLFSVHVPALIEDPSNMGSWAWVTVAGMFLLSGSLAGRVGAK